MTNGDNKMILRLLREIRADQQDQSERLIRVERRFDEVHASMTTALNMAAPSNIVGERFRQPFEEFHDRLAALQSRIAKLGAKP